VGRYSCPVPLPVGLSNYRNPCRQQGWPIISEARGGNPCCQRRAWERQASRSSLRFVPFLVTHTLHVQCGYELKADNLMTSWVRYESGRLSEASQFSEEPNHSDKDGQHPIFPLRLICTIIPRCNLVIFDYASYFTSYLCQKRIILVNQFFALDYRSVMSDALFIAVFFP
jgi:hypothetical protein